MTDHPPAMTRPRRITTWACLLLHLLATWVCTGAELCTRTDGERVLEVLWLAHDHAPCAATPAGARAADDGPAAPACDDVDDHGLPCVHVRLDGDQRRVEDRGPDLKPAVRGAGGVAVADAAPARLPGLPPPAAAPPPRGGASPTTASPGACTGALRELRLVRLLL